MNRKKDIYQDDFLNIFIWRKRLGSGLYLDVTLMYFKYSKHIFCKFLKTQKNISTVILI